MWIELIIYTELYLVRARTRYMLLHFTGASKLIFISLVNGQFQHSCASGPVSCPI